MTLSFDEFRNLIQTQVDLLLGELHLFMTDIDKDAIYNLYLSSFPPGTNPILNTRTSHDCSSCRQFIKQFGGVVGIQGNKLVTVWDVETDDPTYGPVIRALGDYVRSKPIINEFKHTERSISTPFNHGIDLDGNVIVWQHLYVTLSDRFYVNPRIMSLGKAIADTRDKYNTFSRACQELNLNALETVLELISQDLLYRGQEFATMVGQFLDSYKTFHSLPEDQRDNYCWYMGSTLPISVAKIRNSAIGTLLIDLSEGTQVEVAVRKYEAVVAPSNYKRPKPIISKGMIDEAERKITSLGLLDSLGRRFATIEDVEIRNVLWSNTNIMRQRLSGSVFDGLREDTPINPKAFDRVEEIPIKTFIDQLLPTLTSVEVLLEGRHSSNLMSIIGPENKDAASLFKWGNSYSWAYSGNIADSMKERVKAAGGNVQGVLRFSIQWNEDGNNHNDYDAHCIEPNNRRIYFGDKKSRSSGELDVDITRPTREVAVENIIWTNLKSMPIGVYNLLVDVYADRGGTGGFRAEVEFDGEIHSFDCPVATRRERSVMVAKVSLSGGGSFLIEPVLNSNTSISSKSIWSKKTNQFQPVSLITLSPNYWGDEQGVGNLHYMFMIDGLINPDKPNGFFNEFLRPDLNEHRRVFEVLGSRMQVSSDDPKQLSGLGFSSTKRDNLILRTNNKSVIKVMV